MTIATDGLPAFATTRETLTFVCAACGAEFDWRGHRGQRPSSGARFGFSGPLCRRCYVRHNGLRRRSATYAPERRPRRLPGLPVLGGRHRIECLTPRAACRVILAETRRVFRRATG